MKGTTKGHDVFRELEGCIDRSGLPWDKLVSVATDGAPAMCSEKIGVVGLLKEKKKPAFLVRYFCSCALHFAPGSAVW